MTAVRSVKRLRVSLTFHVVALKHGQRFCPAVARPGRWSEIYDEDLIISKHPYTKGFSWSSTDWKVYLLYTLETNALEIINVTDCFPELLKLIETL